MIEAAQTDRTATSSSYKRVCALAAGGVGTVELALREEGRFRRLYAVKRLLDGYRDDASFRAMFLDEARIAGLVRHPNVVSVLDVGEDARGPFLVMDYVEGVSAAALVSRAVDEGVNLPLQVCLRIVMDAAEGLHAAHEIRDARGRPLDLVHRDVSPQNLLVGFDGITRVTDFGIAKALGRSTHTQTGVLKGKFGYMSPEQLRFEEPDRRSDLFSLGIVLFELASGRRLYKNKDGMDGARRILNEPPPDLGDLRDDVPAELVQLLFSMLAKDVEHRPKDAKSVARAIEAILAELVLEEGRVEVGELMQTAFAEERRAQEERVAGALGALTGSLAIEPVQESPTVLERSRPRPWPLALLAALLLATLATLLVRQLGDGGKVDAPPSPEPMSAAAPAEASEPEAELPPEPDPEPEPEAEPEAELAGERQLSPRPQVDRQLFPRPQVDRRRGKRRDSARVPMWEWQ